MKRVFSPLVFLLLQASLAPAQTAIVTRNAHLQPNASGNGARRDAKDWNKARTRSRLRMKISTVAGGFLFHFLENSIEHGYSTPSYYHHIFLKFNRVFISFCQTEIFRMIS
jgi:hypothetical protein